MSTPPTRPRHLLAAAVAALVVLTLGATHLATPAGAQEPEPAPEHTAAATTVNSMTFNGRGWGHGRGMSQYGSQGYATQFGWSTDQILAHYYGGTRKGTVGEATGVGVDPDAMRVRLIAQDAKPTVVAIAGGTLSLAGNNGYRGPTGLTAVRLTRTEGNTLRVEQAPTCTGPWSPVGSDGGTPASQITVARATGSEPLHLCRADGVTLWYPGTLRAVVHEGTQRTVNITSMESMLRSIVPSESPSSWDLEALKAQSVAARSYALAGDSRHQPYADTCDTTLCQVYRGWFVKTPGEARTATTATRTDEAISATSNVVRIHTSGASAGRVARTEFSSTSGGWTAGGTFPAVRDEGDVISPLHTWTRTVAVTNLESAHGQGGRLVEIEVLRRNGLGADGGRVTTARLHFDNGVTADVSGNTVRAASQLLSDWFTPVCGVEGRYITEVFQLFVRRAPTGAETERHCSDVRRGERGALTRSLAVSDEWAGVQINQLYRKILGRDADANGRSYWLGQVERGLRVEEIAAQFYGSAEYFGKAGGTNAGFVSELYDDLLGRAADAEGRDYWARQLDARTIDRQRVAREFYASIESRTDRVDRLFLQILGRGADPDGRAYWTRQLLTLGDVSLAAHLAASEEYYRRAVA